MSSTRRGKDSPKNSPTCRLPAIRSPPGGSSKRPATGPRPCPRCANGHALPTVIAGTPSGSGKSASVKNRHAPVESSSGANPSVCSLSAAAVTAPGSALSDAQPSKGDLPPDVPHPQVPDPVAEALCAAIEAAAAVKRERGTGTVHLVYEMYNEEFGISGGSTTQEAIDDVYSLSFVMPNCRVHLSTLNPSDKRKADIAGAVDIYVTESPLGIYHGLEKGNTYYIYVEQEALRLEQDHERGRQEAEARRAKAAEDAAACVQRDDGRVLESCSCIYGNPCVVCELVGASFYLCNESLAGRVRLSRLVSSFCSSNCKRMERILGKSQPQGWKLLYV